MDLVGILLVVGTPSSGKRDFNYLCSWFDILHFVPLGISFCVVVMSSEPMFNAHDSSM